MHGRIALFEFYTIFLDVEEQALLGLRRPGLGRTRGLPLVVATLLSGATVSVPFRLILLLRRWTSTLAPSSLPRPTEGIVLDLN